MERNRKFAEQQKSSLCLAAMQQHKVTSMYDGQVKFVGLLHKCQQWIGDHGSLWHMHTVTPS